MTGMAGNRDAAWFGGVLVLPVTASRGNQVPTIVLDQLDDLTNLHCLGPALSRQCSWNSGCNLYLAKYITFQAEVQNAFYLHADAQQQLLGIGVQVYLLI